MTNKATRQIALFGDEVVTMQRLTVFEARKMLASNLKFGDDDQILAARVIEQYNEAKQLQEIVDLELNCPECDGEGTIVCPECSGSGDCSEELTPDALVALLPRLREKAEMTAR